MPMTNAQTQSYANVFKNALIVKTTDSTSISDKRVKIAKALADVPADRTKETVNGALFMNLKNKVNMEKPKRKLIMITQRLQQKLEALMLQKSC